MNSRIRWFVLLAAILVCYLPVFRNDFVYDDHGTIAENPFLVRPDAFAQVLTARTFGDPQVLDGQRPLVILSYLVDRALFDATPLACHATSLVWHLASVALLYVLLCRLGLTVGVARMAALLFGLHPALTEAVAVPAFREDLLATFFVLLFLRLALGRQPLWSLAALAAALTAKETAVAAPLLLGWLWVCFPAVRPGRSAMWALLVGAAALVVAYLAVSYSSRPLQASAAVWNGYSLPWPAHLWTAPWLFVRWLKILLVPYPLCVDYVVSPLPSPFDPRCVAGLFAGLIFAAGAWWLRRRQPVVAFGLGWIVVNFGPVSNLVPLFNPLADRYLYLPAAGFTLLLGAAMACVPNRAALVAAVASVYAGLLVLRLGDFRDDGLLWTATARVEPRSARAQTWLGLLAEHRGDTFEAKTRYALADELNPQDTSAIINAAVLEGKAGNLAAAEVRLHTAVTRRPDKFDGWWNLAVALRMQGREAEAEEAVQKARAINPRDPRLHASPGR